MKKPIIIAIVGASGSGKTSLTHYLKEALDIPDIVSYTTRPMRDGERNGIDHWFVDMSFPIPQEPLAYTLFAGHHYWTEFYQVNAPVVTYVIDEKGLLNLQRLRDRYDIVSVLIQRPNNPAEASRQSRDAERIHIADEDYDVVIVNDSTEQKFHQQAILKIGEKLN